MTQRDPRLSVIERVDAVCDRFEAEWRAGRRPSVDAFVAAAPEADREALRSALLAVDAELRAETPAGDTSVSTESVGPARPSPTVEYVGDGSVVPKRIGRFEVRAVLGSGAFGRVYRAYDPTLDREVAVKVPLADAIRGTEDRERFVKEAKAAATISHPNVCQVHEVGEHEGQPYIVMALIPGQSLAEVIRARKEPMAEKQAAIIVRKLALALEAAHRKGVVHRDLKPANIMFDRDRKDIVVMDFGLARRPVSGNERDTRSGVVMGTPAYMSPEQARGAARDVGPEADIFSLGVIFYELLTGSRPFTGTAYEVISQILLVEPQPPSQRRPGVDPLLESICLKALAKDPARRFASMKEFATALDGFLRRPADPLAETARAVKTTQDRDEANVSSARKIEEVFEALSEQQRTAQAETAAAVEAAAVKARTPRWIFVGLAVLLVGGLTAIAGIVFFAQTDKVKVTIELKHIDLADRTLSYFLDEEPISAEQLAKPIELKPGDHVLVVKRGKAIVNRLLLTVTGGRSPGIRVTDITPEPVELPPPSSTDRTAAEWVLSVGGRVRVADRPATTLEECNALPVLRRADELPDTPFKLSFVGLEGKIDETNEADLAKLNGLKHLQLLNLRDTRVTDRGLAAIPELTGLTWLYLPGTKVTDAGLPALKGLKALKEIDLTGCPVTNEGLLRLQRDLPGCRITPEPKGNLPTDFTPLFNGRDLTGWATEHGNAGQWKVVEGAITCSGPASCLYTDRNDYGDFHFRAEVKVNEKGNSGIYFRAGKPVAWVGDYEAQICTRPDQQKTGGLYGLVQFQGNLVEPDTWFTYEVIAQGTRLKVLVNGKETANYQETRQNRRLRGHIAIQHYDAATTVFYRKIELKTCADPDRAAAEWVLSVGGAVAAADPAHLPATAEAAMGLPPIKAREKLPRTPFKLVGVNFGGYEGKLDESNEAGLAALNGLEHLQALNLTYSRVTDRGLEALRDLPSLRHLLVHGTRVTDAAMKTVGRFRKLESLSLNLTPITDAGLAELTTLDALRDLALLQTRVSDRGLKVVGQFKRLERLNLGATQITDTGLAELAGLTELNELVVSAPQFTGTGLKHLQGLPKLAILQLGPGLTDAGLAGAAGLLRVTRLHLTRTPDVTDAGLKHLAGMTQLEFLKILAKGVTDDGLAHLAKLDRLWDLTVADASITDLGLKHLVPLWRLKNLDLARTAVTGTGLKELAKLTQLGSLDLSGCPITDVGLPEVNKLNGLERLVLAQTKVTDAGLTSLKNLAALREINLTGCPVTTDGLLRLKRDLPGCRITPEPKDANRAGPE